VQHRTRLEEFKMIEDRLSDLKWRKWTPESLNVLGNLQQGRCSGALPVEYEARAEALKLIRSMACYRALSAACGPDDDLELSRLQQIEYAIYAHVSTLHRLGWSFRWASDARNRSMVFTFCPRKPAKSTRGARPI
jgi:hypothetical protein